MNPPKILVVDDNVDNQAVLVDLTFTPWVLTLNKTNNGPKTD
ncbi:hypothetical protein BGS_1263 [Beggiatoa sp. SS]|nr:hypothetical protein BGS_1263 [Beggiatoa sp. SS]